jgi:hypothetical protein
LYVMKLKQQGYGVSTATDLPVDKYAEVPWVFRKLA